MFRLFVSIFLINALFAVPALGVVKEDPVFAEAMDLNSSGF